MSKRVVRKRYVFAMALLVALITLLMTACGGEESGNSSGQAEQVSDSGFYLDTECTITVYEMNAEVGQEKIDEAFKLCEEYEKLLSKTIEGSDVYKINHAGAQPVKVDAETKNVIALSLKMSEESEGKFDITIGRLTDLWDFKADNPEVPAEDDIKAAIETVDYRNVRIDGNNITVKGGQSHIDLGGVAKGYISHKLAKHMEKKGVKHAIINLGGNVVTIGEKPGGESWNIGIQDPNGEGQEILGATKAKDEAIITSGVYERKFEENGKTYHHIIDPKTGYPVDNDIEGVTIKASSENAGLCDAYSTICLLMGVKDGKKFIEEKEGFEAVFFEKGGKITKTSGMDFEEMKE